MKKLDINNLFKAAKQGNWNTLNSIISKNPNSVNIQDEEGKTPLFWAVSDNHLQIVESLLKKGADAAVVTYRNRYVPLHEAIGKPKIIELILKHNKNLINSQDIDGLTPLLWAIKLSELESIIILLSNKADVNIGSELGLFALHQSIAKNLKIIKSLLKYEQELTNIGKVIEIFLLRGIDPNIKDNNNKTALDYAIKEEYFSVSKLLCMRGAEVNASMQTTKAYNRYAEFKQLIDQALVLKPLMKWIKNLFIRNAIKQIEQNSIDDLEELPKANFKSNSLEQNNITYKNFCNYYEIAKGYFNHLLAKEMLEAKKLGVKELQNLVNIVHNNIKKAEVFDRIIFKDSLANIITLTDYFYQDSKVQKANMCLADSNSNKINYAIFSLQTLSIMQVSKMLKEKQITHELMNEKLSKDVIVKMVNLENTINTIGDGTLETIENLII